MKELDITDLDVTESEADSWQESFYEREAFVKTYHFLTDEITKQLWELSMFAEERVDELDRQNERIKRQIFVLQAVSLLLATICVILLMRQKRRKGGLFPAKYREALHAHREQQRDEMLMYFSRAYFEVYGGPASRLL